MTVGEVVKGGAPFADPAPQAPAAIRGDDGQKQDGEAVHGRPSGVDQGQGHEAQDIENRQEEGWGQEALQRHRHQALAKSIKGDENNGDQQQKHAHRAAVQSLFTRQGISANQRALSEDDGGARPLSR